MLAYNNHGVLGGENEHGMVQGLYNQLGALIYPWIFCS